MAPDSILSVSNSTTLRLLLVFFLKYRTHFHYAEKRIPLYACWAQACAFSAAVKQLCRSALATPVSGLTHCQDPVSEQPSQSGTQRCFSQTHLFSVLQTSSHCLESFNNLGLSGGRTVYVFKAYAFKQL